MVVDWNSVGAAVGAVVALAGVFLTFFRDRDKTQIDVGTTYVAGLGDIMTANKELREELSGQVAKLREELREERERCEKELQEERERCDRQISELRETVRAVAKRLDDYSDPELELAGLVELDLDAGED